MSEHEEKAEDVERELDDMEEQSGRLHGEIEGTREDWDRKKRDSRVPGAEGEPEKADEPGPETDYPAKGDED